MNFQKKKLLKSPVDELLEMDVDLGMDQTSESSEVEIFDDKNNPSKWKPETNFRSDYATMIQNSAKFVKNPDQEKKNKNPDQEDQQQKQVADQQTIPSKSVQLNYNNISSLNRNFFNSFLIRNRRAVQERCPKTPKCQLRLPKPKPALQKYRKNFF